KWSMRSLRDCESQPHRSRSVSAGEAVSTHPLSSPTCSEVGESRGSFAEVPSCALPLTGCSRWVCFQGVFPLSHADELVMSKLVHYQR
ncbi:hypothetical protein PN462_02710, partial [Spirulina sp. CS-785/01]|uniref:hypothetical protein n=1 Tax=Spirulina sp. CS-785/01 TaxID=3021716 RepID=UPI00232CB0AB